jgi:hypothetical protein
MKSIVRKCPNTVLFLVLSVSLFGPYYLKLIDPKLEPYPAVILPSGAFKAWNNSQQLHAQTIEVVGFDAKTGEEKVISHKELLGKVPSHYFMNILERRFGLKTEDNVSRKYHQSTKQWLRNRLRRQGLKEQKFIVRQVNFRIDKSTGIHSHFKIRSQDEIILD